MNEPLPAKPNVIIIIMDDLCWGDLACHGNPYINTPNLDRLHSQSVRVNRYYSGPLCSPARAALMTGRYSYRTGVVDTYIGRSMMHGDEITMANMLGDAGYRTGAFGKWHLGDTYPMRACDQGFEESVMHGSGGIGQPGDYPGNTYFDPVLQHNGMPEKYAGYCTDIFADQTLRFIEEHRDEPFFTYMATNCPHSPFQIDEQWVKPYRDKGVNDTHAKVYGMVENIDMNVGRILDKLEELNIADNTVVMFTSDHGPCGSAKHEGEIRYNAGLRDIKGSMYDGGIRVPCLIRWPECFREAFTGGGRDVSALANPIDLLPTFAAITGAAVPSDRVIDGVNLLPVLQGQADANTDRRVFVQWHRGDIPQRFQNCAVITRQHKLVNGEELYDLINDYQEANDIAAANADVVRALRADYEKWFDDVSSTRGFTPPRIVIGSAKQNPVHLSRQDWLGPDRDPQRVAPQKGMGWTDIDVGYWEVTSENESVYTFTLAFGILEESATATLKIGATTLSKELLPGDEIARFDPVILKAGEARIEAWLTQGDVRLGARYVDVYRQGPRKQPNWAV